RLYRHRVGALIYIDELRDSTRLRDRLSCCYEGIRNRQDDISRHNPGCDDRESKSISSTPNAHGVAGSAERCKRSFKLLHYGPTNKAASQQGTPERVGQLPLEL